MQQCQRVIKILFWKNKHIKEPSSLAHVATLWIVSRHAVWMLWSCNKSSQLKCPRWDRIRFKFRCFPSLVTNWATVRKTTGWERRWGEGSLPHKHKRGESDRRTHTHTPTHAHTPAVEEVYSRASPRDLRRLSTNHLELSNPAHPLIEMSRCSVQSSEPWTCFGWLGCTAFCCCRGLAVDQPMWTAVMRWRRPTWCAK